MKFHHTSGTAKWWEKFHFCVAYPLNHLFNTVYSLRDGYRVANYSWTHSACHQCHQWSQWEYLVGLVRVSTAYSHIDLYGPRTIESLRNPLQLRGAAHRRWGRGWCAAGGCRVPGCGSGGQTRDCGWGWSRGCAAWDTSADSCSSWWDGWDPVWQWGACRR